MLPHNKSRRIRVAGNAFRYAISRTWKDNGLCDLNITVQSESHNGSKLLVKGLVSRDFWLDFPDPELDPGVYPIVTPRHIEHFIKRAVQGGWNYSTSGPDHVLSVTNDKDLSHESNCKS